MIYATFACDGVAFALIGVQAYYMNKIRKIRRDRERLRSANLSH